MALWFAIFLLAGIGGGIFFKEKKLQVKSADAEERKEFILKQTMDLDAFEEGNSKQWEIEEIAGRIKEEVFLNREGELLACFQNPLEKIPYTERKRTEDFHVTVVQNEEEQYRFFIPENLYIERKMNTWLQEFYQREVEAEAKFMGVGIKESDLYFTEEERIQYGFSYITSFRIKRADDIVISFFINTYQYAGGVHGWDISYSKNFDTRKGECLELEDIIFDADTKAFWNRIMEFIKEDYGENISYQEIDALERALQEGSWYLSGYGIHFFF